MAFPLQQSLELVKKLRAENGAEVAHLNDQELADLAYEQTKDDRLLPAAKSSAIMRGVSKTGEFFFDLGASAESAISDNTSPFPQKVAGRVVRNLVSSVPEMGASVLAAGTKGVPRALAALGGSAFSYGRTKAETGDETAALGSGASFLASLAGGIKGAQVGEKLAGEAARPLAKAVAGTAGSMLGSAPGDALGIATSPGGFEEFISDPVNLPAYLAGQPVGDAGTYIAQKAAQIRKTNVEKTKAATPDLESFVEKSDADRLVELNKKPLSERTELETEEIKQLSRKLAKDDERIVAASVKPAEAKPSDLGTLAETPATLASQLYLAAKGKKAVVELPKGQQAPNVYFEGFKTHESEVNGNTYFYDETKTTPEQIDNAVRTNSLGYLLGYGVPSLPANPSGEVAVLRSKRGAEKAAVVLSDETKQTVLDSLNEMKLGDDVVSVESPEQVFKWRQENSGLLKLYSIAGGEQINPQSEISFTNHVLDMFERSVVTKQSGTKFKGPRFQLDQQGQLGGKGLLKAIKEWAPSELFEHYKERGIETILGVDKVKAADFNKWLRENTPEVEVKKLIPRNESADNRVFVLQHELETQRGLEIRGSRVYDVTGNEVTAKHIEHGKLVEEFQRLRQVQFEAKDNDAATGRYGIEPKELKDMPGAVDILVRVPRQQYSPRTIDERMDRDPNYMGQGVERNQGPEGGFIDKPLFQGPHFGDSDVNVLASIRGYEEVLPSGEKVFHVFEVQSDWGQKKAKFEQAAKDAKLPDTPMSRAGYGFSDHPLLSHYETLALKTAIQHARSIGATKLAISDAETAMMTEGHDRYTNPDAGLPTIDGVVPLISQEPGMRAAYDQRLPAIMKKLTGQSGDRVNFGSHKVGDSPVFKRADFEGRQVPKGNITARLYDITNLRPEVRRLFSLYDADAQATFESVLRDEKTRSEQLTQEQVLEQALGGNRRVEPALVRFLNAINGERGAIRAESFADTNVLASADLSDRTIALSPRARANIKTAFTKLSHEFTHFGIADLSPAQRDALVKVTNDLSPAGRLGILNELKKQLKLDDTFDPAYLSGSKFDPADPNYGLKVAHEFAGGLVEAAANAHFDKTVTAEWLKWLPTPIQALLTKVVGKIKQYFSPEFPSVSAMLNDHEAAHLNQVVDLLQRNVVSAQQANLRALLKLKESRAFDESTFLDQLTSSKPDFAQLPRGSEVMYSWASDIIKGAKDGIRSRYENHLFSPLFRARTNPATAGHYWALHNFRPSIKADEHGYLSFLGQLPDGSLSRQQAIERWAKFFDSITNPSNPRRNTFLEAFGKINEENQNRIEQSKVPLKDADLVSLEQMQSEYKLTSEEAGFAQRIIKMSELVAKEAQRKSRQVDVINLSKLFYGANKQQNIEGVRQKVARLSRITEEAGMKRFELESYRRRLDKLRKAGEPDLEAEAETQMEIQRLTSEEGAFKTLLDQSIRAEFAGAIPFRDGDDPFIRRAGELMIRLSALRAQAEIITGNSGWASMTRRGRYRIRVYEPSELGEEFARVKEYKGFKTEEAMNKYIADNKLPESSYEKFDMHDIKNRVRAFTPDRLKYVRDLAKTQLDEILNDIQAKAGELDPELSDTITRVISEVQSSFQPLEQEYKDVVSVKGDKFGERRYNITGFDANDFLPNIFEYMSYKTVAGNKALAQAESNLQISRREFDNDPELRDRMYKEQQYVLGKQTEYNLAKKAIFYYYLGASFRHIVQNAVQIPLNGISQMVSEGHGLQSYKHFSNAAKLLTKYNIHGSTGDVKIDAMLKQAEKDGISFSSVIEAPVHETAELQNVLDSISANADGNVGFGERIKYAGTKVVKGMEKFLQSTSFAAEEANRKTAFVASILAERARGNTDLRSIYDKAGQFTNYVNFVGDKPNRPGYMVLHGNTPVHGVLGLLTTLQSFTVNHISQLYSFYDRGFRQGNKADKQAFAVGLAHLLAFSGSLGFVGASTAEQLFEELTGVSLKTALREKLVQTMDEHPFAADRIADTVLGGFPALLGIDASNSIGLGSPFFRYQAGSPIAAEQFGGAGVGALGRVATAVGQVTEDPFNPQAWWNATRTASPAFLSNALKVYDLLSEGATLDKNQQPIGDTLGVSGSVATLLGFTPTETAKQREFNSRVYKETKKSAEDYERNVLNISRLIYEYEKTGNEDALLRANAMFSAYTESVAGLQNRDTMIGSIADQLAQNRGKITRPASLKDSATRQKLEQAFPSITPRYASAVDGLFDELAVAQLLGQDDVLGRKLSSLPQSLRHKTVADALTSVGLRPEELQGLTAPKSALSLGY